MIGRTKRARNFVSDRSSGFSLVELMIALSLGLFLLGGIIQLLVSSRISYRVGEQVARVQENGRYVVNLFAERARQSLSMGCRNAMMEIPLDGVAVAGDALVVSSCLLRQDTSGCSGESAVRTDAALGYDASEQGGTSWLADMPDGASNPVAARWLRGDVLVVWGTDGAGTLVDTFTEDTTVTPPEINQMTLVGTNRELGSGAEAALITNCEQSHLFDIENSDGASLTIGAGTGEALSGNYNIADDAAETFGQQPMNKAAVYAFGYEAYFICCTDSNDGSLIADNPQQCTGTSDRYIPALCRWRAGGTTQALISGVADMRITYSGDTDDDQVIDFRASDADTVHSAAWVTEQDLWPKVVGAQIELLVLSVELDPLARTSVAASELTRGVGLFSDVETKAPIDLRWPPNDPDTPPNSPAEDTLGYTLRNLTDNRRLFERFVISAAFRARAPWYIEE